MSRQFLQRLFFHLSFWPRTWLRWWRLLLQRNKLKVESVGLDQAFYLEGSWVWLEWKVEHAWLVRVNHPGGFYPGSDSTWFTAAEGMAPVQITFYGIGRKVRHRFPVPVRSRKVPARTQALQTAQMRTTSIHQGPRYQARTRALLHPRTRIRTPEPGPYPSENPST